MSAPTNLTVKLPTSAAEVAKLQREIEVDAKELIEVVRVVDDESYTAADALLTDIVRRKDAAVAMRKTATNPMYTAIRTVEGWFKPLVTAAEGAERHIKKEMRLFLERRDAEQRQARELAAKAAEQDDAETMMVALEAAAAVTEKPASRAVVAMGWRVKRVAEELLPDEFWIVDVARLDKLAAQHKGDDPPIVPGVTFERHAKIGAKR